MLDLLITYINLLILSIKYLVKRIIFHPPNPISYKIIETSIKDKKTTEIYIKNRSYKSFHKVKKKVHLDIEFHKIPDRYNNKIPIFVFKPKLSLHGACIIYCHGNSCDLGTTFTLCCDLAKFTKCIVVNFDYPGYGIYQNIELNEKNIYHTVQVIYEYVKEKLKFDENSIIVYGFSLGTGVAFDLACNEKYKFAGLILQSPFLSIIRTMYNTKRTLYFDLFNNCDKAKFLKIKTLFIHGNKDNIVPYVHGRILSKLIPQNKLFGFQTVDGAGHNNIFIRENLAILSEVIRHFIEKCCHLIIYKDHLSFLLK
jgi:pimeloyl-ACP methyl ester carboxylesterase